MTERPFVPVGVAVLAVSDTRTLADDRSGAFIAERIETMGHRLAFREIVVDEEETIRATIRRYMEDDSVDIVITTGGTGMTYRDVTPEAVAPLGTKHIPGFGELFRYLSYEEIGTSTVQSRADGWLCDDTIVFVLPGSTGACRTAMDKILVQQLDVRHRPCNFIEMLPRIKRPKTNQG
jgi:molybdopterin adenylyltransferase